MRKLRALLANDASLAGHHGSALVISRAVELARCANIDITHGWDWNAVERAVRSGHFEFDLIIVNGEGSVHDDSPTARRIAALAKIAHARRIPAYLINTSTEELGPEVVDGIAKFRLCFTRDSLSRDVLSGAGIQSFVVPDLTLSWGTAPRARSQGQILVTDSSDAGKSRLQLSIAKKCPRARMISLRTEPPVPMRGSLGRRVRFELKRLIAKSMPLTPWSLRYGGIRTREELTDLMVRSSGILSARYHAVCFALCMRLPFLAIEGNTRKIGALLEDVGLSSRLVPIAEISKPQWKLDIPRFSPEEEQRIDMFLKRAARDAVHMFELIAEDARSPTAQ